MDPIKHRESHGVKLGVVCAEVLSEVSTALLNMGEREVVSQLPDVLVPAQDLNGTSERFSFMAYPVPRLSSEERETMELRDARSIRLKLKSGSVQIELDDFQQINWFHVSDVPEMYSTLKKGLLAKRSGAS
jgi:hypothetical protein